MRLPTIPFSALAAMGLLLSTGASRTQALPAKGTRADFSATEAKQRAEIFLERRGLDLRKLERTGAPAPAWLLMRAREQSAALPRVVPFLRAGAGPRTLSQTASTAWQPAGPMQVSTAAWGLVTGRVTSLAADPSDASGNTLYVGTTGGGVWKSTNAAAAAPAFAPLTDDVGTASPTIPASLSIGAVSVQPGATGVILAGTGDPNDATDSWYGDGILRSTDGGVTWILNSFTALGSISNAYYSFIGNAIAGFAWSGSTPNVVVAAVTQSERGAQLSMPGTAALPGLYYSQDAGATWQLATLQDGTMVIEGQNLVTQAGNAVTAVVWNPVRQSFYAAVRYHGYYSSPDGITWTRLTQQPGVNLTTAMCPSASGTSGSPACPIFRGALAVQPVTGDMFALTVDENNLDQGLWQDVCGETNGACAASVAWARQIADEPLQNPGGTIAAADYNLWLAAVPSQQDTLLFAGTQDIWRCSLANSCVWRNTTNTQTCAGAQVAPGQHAVESTFGSTGLLYFGNDGGLWRTTDAVDQQSTVCSPDDAAHFQNLNGGLGSLAEVESFSQDPNNPDTWLAALGALGTAAPETGTDIWTQVLDGDGTQTAIDPVHPQNWYATSEFGVGINQCTEGTSCDQTAFGSVVIGEPQVDNDVQEIPAPWMLDPLDPSQVILGTCRVWRGPADGSGWSSSDLLSAMLDGDQTTTFCNGNAEIGALAAAPTGGVGNAERIYAGIAGVENGGGLVPGNVFSATVDSNSAVDNTAWTNLYASPVDNDANPQFNPGQFAVSSLYVDPHDATGNTVYVTIEGFSGAYLSEPLIYRSTDGGADWVDLSANMPNAPANSVVVDPNDANTVYVATDAGVYITQDVASCATQPTCWNVYGTGLPNAPAIQLSIFQAGSSQWLRVGTYGRGIWQVALATAGEATTTAAASPGSLSFAAQQEYVPSAEQPVVVTNTGTLNLNISGVAITGDFTETDTCNGASIAPAGACTLQVVFTPSAAGTRQGVLTLSADVAGGQITVPLTGTGLAPGDISLNPGNLSFSGTLVGTRSAVQTVSIENSGGAAVALTSESVTGDFAVSGNSCGASLAGGSSCSVGIAFAPTTDGALTGTLAVKDSEGTQTVLLSGTGETAATDALAPLSLAFAAQQVETASAAQTVTLTNSGDEPLTSISVTIAGDFTAVNNCGRDLQGDDSCTIAVAYVPTQTGAETGMLTVSDALRTQTVSLSGTGLAPPGASATPRSIDFGGEAPGATSAAQTVTVTNNGGYPLTGLAATVSPGFSIAANQCAGTLAVGAGCQLGIAFTAPATAGPVAGSLTIAASNLAAPLTVSLSGAAVDFALGSSGSSSAVVVSGQAAGFALELSGLGGTTGNVTLTCGGVPENALCAFGLAENGACPSATTATVAISGANTSTASLCVSTGVATASAAAAPGAKPGWRRDAPLLALLLPLPLLALRRRRWAQTLLVVAILLLPLGCGVSASGGGSAAGGGGGGGTGSQNATPSGNYVLTVTGTMSGITHSTSVTLTVQ